MNNVKVVFAAPWKVEVHKDDFSVPSLNGNQVFVKKKLTLISAGTELACLAGVEHWFSLPGTPGYASVAEIMEIGPLVEGYEKGDLVLFYGNHSLYEVTTTEGNRFNVFAKVPEGLELTWAPFARMAAVAMTAIRVSEIELGDRVAVTGLGLVGNLAAQLAALQGAEVIGIDLSHNRLEIAKRCGLAFPVLGTPVDAKQMVMDLTAGAGVSTLIEATGVTKVAVDSVSWIRPYGELILLGTPRGVYETDATDLLSYVHLESRGCITFKGAHEWRFPTLPDPFVKHSLTRNMDVILDLMLKNKLLIEPLLSHIVAPEEAPAAYDGLHSRKDEYQGVLFDWRSL